MVVTGAASERYVPKYLLRTPYPQVIGKCAIPSSSNCLNRGHARLSLARKEKLNCNRVLRVSTAVCLIAYESRNPSTVLVAQARA